MKVVLAEIASSQYEAGDYMGRLLRALVHDEIPHSDLMSPHLTTHTNLMITWRSHEITTIITVATVIVVVVVVVVVAAAVAHVAGSAVSLSRRRIIVRSRRKPPPLFHFAVR
jgi:hypothetical protein